MLEKLTIKNIALIDSVQIDFTSGLNVLSGETGAGKSVIIESLNFVLGAKADKTLIRSGESECFVKAEFNVSENQTIYEVFDEADIEKEDVLIITRKFSTDGKSSIKVNGNTVTLSMLKKFTASLVDVHGQSEHFHLLKVANQLNLIDKFGGDEIDRCKREIKTDFSEYKSIKEQLNKLGGDEGQRQIRLDVIKYQINEIESCDLKDGEEEELLEIRDKLKFQEKIISALSSLKSAISDEGGASDVLSNASRVILSISDLGKEYSELSERLDSAYSEISDIADSANSLLEEFEYSEYNPDQIEERLSLIKNIKKKYGSDFNQIQEFLASIKEEQNRLENFDDLAKSLNDKKQELENVLYKKYTILSNARRKYSKEFSQNVLEELHELGMSKAKFEIVISDSPSISECAFDSANGFDNLEFFFSANLGEPLKPLSAVISGGEMSRFMLSIKAQTAKYNDISTFIFDEIDAGISGMIAKVVAEKFARISKDTQIIAITHLPQISAMADNNLLIVKTENESKTVTTVKRLSSEEKIDEITRLIGGEKQSESARVHSKELIDTAEKFKKSI